jgi:hypothetical protein
LFDMSVYATLVVVACFAAALITLLTELTSSLAPTNMESLSIDMSHPAVQDYLSLVRYTLPIFCPFILDMSFHSQATGTHSSLPSHQHRDGPRVCNCCLAFYRPCLQNVPNLDLIQSLYHWHICHSDIRRADWILFPSGISEKTRNKGTFHHFISVDLRSVLQKTLVKGVGFALVFSNWVMALWAICWVFQLFIPSTILQALLVLLLLYANIVLLVYHKPTRSRPFDAALIHAPMRFFFILPLYLLFPYSLL